MIRLAKIADSAMIQKLVKDFGYEASEEETMKVVKLHIEHDDSWAYVAEIDEQVVGAMSLNSIPCFHKDGFMLRVTFIYVDPFHRRKGLASGLIDEAKRKAIEGGFDTIELTTGNHRAEEAHLFYKNCGFKEYEGKRFILRRNLIQ